MFFNIRLNYQYIESCLNHSEDIIRKTIYIYNSQLIILYFKTMIDQNTLQEKLYNPLLSIEETVDSQIIQQKIHLNHTSISTIKDVIQKKLLQGYAIVF
ncbi:hypothetical protein GH868_28050 [Bacillus thuringiensis]|nr:hypothetical protein [Bacillus thuringiensis]MRA93825.1 hypothetical protein [Bacillus thuringiensis]MRC56547.1 hypothetical protein [Bacillus thuringiensis]HDR4441086.1 spore germination protein [Bacillus cereus]